VAKRVVAGAKPADAEGQQGAAAVVPVVPVVEA
jgi:hypothetical protein